MFESFDQNKDDFTNHSSTGMDDKVYQVDDTYSQQSSSNSSACSQIDQLPSEVSDAVHRHAAGVVVVHRILNSVPAILVALFCGAWSDTRGRKLPMMVPSAGSCLAVVFYMLCVRMNHTRLRFLLAGAATQGAFGKTPLISMAVNSYVSDTSDIDQRTRRLGRLLGSSFLGIFLGSFLAGVLQDVSDLATTLVIVSVCHVWCILVVLFGITEVVSEDGGTKLNSTSGYEDRGSDTIDETERSEEGGGGGDGQRKNEHGLFSWEGLKESLMTVLKKREGGKRCVIIISLTALALTQVLKVGKIFSIQACLETLAKLIGSPVFTGIYAATVNVLSAAAYLSEVIVYLFMGVLLLWLGRLLEKNGAHELKLTIPKPYHSVSNVEENTKRTLRSSIEISPMIPDTDVSQSQKERQ